MTGSVLEIVEFRASADKDTVQEAASQLEPWLAKQPGFKWRRLSMFEDGTLIDCIEWSDMASAKSAANKIMSEPLAGGFMRLIDGSSVIMRHAKVLVSQ